jgi:alanyl-tRNA synthetase
MGDAFPELKAQQVLIEKVIHEEETSFYRTLETGLKRLENICEEAIKNKNKTISGKAVF